MLLCSVCILLNNHGSHEVSLSLIQFICISKWVRYSELATCEERKRAANIIDTASKKCVKLLGRAKTIKSDIVKELEGLEKVSFVVIGGFTTLFCLRFSLKN